MIPKKRTGKVTKYDFESMELGKDYIKAKDYPHAKSISGCALKRGYNACIRTVGVVSIQKIPFLYNEIRVYLVEKR